MSITGEAEFSPPAVAPAGGERTLIGKHATSHYSMFGKQSKTGDSNSTIVIFLGDCGQKFGHKGKVGRVLKMLATNPSGITQYSTYPWHTRLAASIKVLRDSGLIIQTEREDSTRHARYILQTGGKLIGQSQAKEDGQ